MAPFGASRAGLMSVAADDIPDSEADQKLIHRWVMDEGEGTIVEDTVGDEDGTIQGNVDWTSGNFIEETALDSPGGSGDLVEFGTLGDFGSNMASDFAVAYTIVLDDANGEGLMWNRLDSGTELNISLGGSSGVSTDTPVFGFRDDTEDRVYANSTESIADGEPRRIVCNKTGNSASDLEIWINKTETAEVNRDEGVDTSELSNFDQDLPLFARNIQGSLGEWIDCVIDDVCFFNDSLTQSEIESYDNPWD